MGDASRHDSSSAAPSPRRFRSTIPYFEAAIFESESQIEIIRKPDEEADRCRELWRSVLAQTIKDALGIGEMSLGHNPTARRTALEWFKSFSTDKTIGSFHFISDVLGLNVFQVRRIQNFVLHPPTDLLQILHTCRYNTLKSA